MSNPKLPQRYLSASEVERIFSKSYIIMDWKGINALI